MRAVLVACLFTPTLMFAAALVQVAPPVDAATPPETVMRDTCCDVIELRQYTLHAGRREALVGLFEREFVESQEALGAQVAATFRQEGAPDRFVWLRGFADMVTRRAALQAFYTGPTWQAHRDAANATMIDSDNVLLLRPIDAKSRLTLSPTRALRDAAGEAGGDARIVATIAYRDAPVDDAFIAAWHARVVPALRAMGAAPIAAFTTEYAVNDFPALPVRTGEHVFVWLARFDDAAAATRFIERRSADATWRDQVAPIFSRGEAAPMETLVLAPTARSRLR